MLNSGNVDLETLESLEQSFIEEPAASEYVKKVLQRKKDSLESRLSTIQESHEGGGGNFSRISSPVAFDGLLVSVKNSIKNLYKNSLKNFFGNTSSMETSNSNGEIIEIDVVNGFEDNYMMEIYFKTFKYINGLKQTSISSSSRSSSSRSSRSKKKSKRKKRSKSSSSEGGGKNKSKRLNNKRSNKRTNKRNKRVNNKRSKRRSKRRFS